MCRLVPLMTSFKTEISVADIKKRHIENIIESAEKCDKIDAIVLFGSALEDRCKEDSDIDFAIISKHTVSSLCRYKSFHEFSSQLYSKDLDQDYDILYFKSLEEIEDKKDHVGVCKELAQKGKVIYKGGA